MTPRRLAALALAVLVLAPAPGFAQGERMAELAKTPPPVRAKLQTALMKEKLGLTPEQLPKVEAINLDTATQMQPVLESSAAPLVRMRQARTIGQQKDTALAGVLTPSQQQQWLASKQELEQKLEQKLLEKKSGGGM